MEASWCPGKVGWHNGGPFVHVRASRTTGHGSILPAAPRPEDAMRSSVDPRWGIAIAIVMAFAGAGCTQVRHYYRVVMKPVSDGLSRELYAFSIDQNRKPFPWPEAVALDSVVCDRLEQAYGIRPDMQHPYRAGRRFAVIPRDFDNTGFYRVVKSPLGSTGVYLERFGGPEHPSEFLVRPIDAADSLQALTQTWFAAELEDHAGWPGLRSYLDGELRTQLRDLASHGLVFEDDPELVSLILQEIEDPELVALVSLGGGGWDEVADIFPAVFDTLRTTVA